MLEYSKDLEEGGQERRFVRSRDYGQRRRKAETGVLLQCWEQDLGIGSGFRITWET